MSRIIVLTMPNGLVLEGTQAQLETAARRLGYSLEGFYYASTTKGLILIADMETSHLRNAILKQYKNWLDSLYKLSPREMVLAMKNGLQDKTWIAMVKELATRER